jgi:predicted ribosome quality control (RQC) complex YloA/Tae2 family protein
MGENAKENWELCFHKFAEPEKCYWLHLSSFPSCHVIIESENPSPEHIQYAGIWCLDNTRYKNMSPYYVKVDVTKLSNLLAGPAVGSVHYKSRRKVSKIPLLGRKILEQFCGKNHNINTHKYT